MSDGVWALSEPGALWARSPRSTYGSIWRCVLGLRDRVLETELRIFRQMAVMIDSSEAEPLKEFRALKNSGK